MSSSCLVFHTSEGISSSPAGFLFLIFLRTKSSSSWVNGLSLMSNHFLIILVIGSCVTFGGFPRRFSKCYFHSSILSWFAAFSFALVVLFLLLISFIVCQDILDCLSSTDLIYLIFLSYPQSYLSDFVCILSDFSVWFFFFCMYSIWFFYLIHNLIYLILYVFCLFF